MNTLIEKGNFNVNRTWFCTSPLVQAIKWRNVKIVGALLAAGADPNGPPETDAGGNLKRTIKPLRMAVLMQSVEKVRLLLNHGASLSGPLSDSDKGLSLVDTARSRGEGTPMLKLLLDAQAKEDAQRKVLKPSLLKH